MLFVRSAFLLFAFLLIQGCDSVYTRDILERSVSQATLPLAGARLPPVGDAGVMIQASLAAKVQRNGPRTVELGHQTGDPDLVVETRDAHSTLAQSRVQMSGQFDLWANSHFRLGFAADAGSVGGSFGVETGVRFGDPVSIEVFAGTGLARSHSEAVWRTEIVDDNGGGDDPKWDSTRLSQNRGYGLVGCHLGARRDGPWVEGVLLHQVLFNALSGPNHISMDLPAVAAGWSIYPEWGTATLFARGVHQGGDVWNPSAGLQFTWNLRIDGARGDLGE